MRYSIEIQVIDKNDNLCRIIRGNELDVITLNYVDANVEALMNDMSYKTRHIQSCLELLEAYIDDHADSMAYKDQAIEDRRTLKFALDELEALL